MSVSIPSLHFIPVLFVIEEFDLILQPVIALSHLLLGYRPSFVNTHEQHSYGFELHVPGVRRM